MKALQQNDWRVRLLLSVVFIFACLAQSFSQFKNFDKAGRPVVRFSTTGDAIDAHDGEIACFEGVYYLYGTSYDCGFQWGNKGAPFCGFKVYSSKDLHNWTDRGLLFDPKTPLWQSRCDGKTYGCFRPHIVYNKKTRLYVLWINVYDNVVGYRVFTSPQPVGPFTETAEPKLAVNADMPAAGLNNGDHDTFVDDDGTAYLAYTDWRTQGTIVIEKLSADYLTGTGEHVKAITKGQTEAPGLFKRKGTYYVVYSDPNCGYCSGTGTSYRTAPTPLGPWSEGKKISDNSCGGQPSFVSTVKINMDTVYLYGSDLWNNGAKNEALANYYWAPLTFAADGSIKPLNCLENYRLPKAGKGNAGAQAIQTENVPIPDDYRLQCDIAGPVQRAQSFTASRSGVLAKLNLTVFKNNDPDQGLTIAIYRADGFDTSLGAGFVGAPGTTVLFITTIASGAVGWSAKNITLAPALRVKKGGRYVLVLSSAAASGCYGVALGDVVRAADGAAADGAAAVSKDGSRTAVSRDGGATFTVVEKQTLKFQPIITVTPLLKPSPF